MKGKEKIKMREKKRKSRAEGVLCPAEVLR